MGKRKEFFTLCLLLVFFGGAICALGQDTANEGGQGPAAESNEGTPIIESTPTVDQATIPVKIPIPQSSPTNGQGSNGQPCDNPNEDEDGVNGQLEIPPGVSLAQEESPDPGEQTNDNSVMEPAPQEQTGEPQLQQPTPETFNTEQIPDGTVSVEATVTITPVENPIVQNLHTESGLNYVKKADGKLYDPLGNEVAWADAGQLLDDNGNIVEPPAYETVAGSPEQNSGENHLPEGAEDIESETSDPLTTVDPEAITDPTALVTGIKEVTIKQDVFTGQYKDTETGEKVDVADLSQSVVIEANNQVIDVVATIEIIDQVATAIISGEQSVVIIGDGNIINVIANILAAVSDLFVDWSQIVHVHGDNNIINAQVNVDATAENTAKINTQTRLEINLPGDVPPEVAQSILSISHGEYATSYPAPKAPAIPEIRSSIDLKMNEVLYREGGSTIEAIEFINTGNKNQSYLVGALKLRFVDTNTGNLDAIVDLAANPDPNNKNHTIVPGEIKVKDLTGQNILAMDERIDLIGYFYVGNVRIVRVFDSMECTWTGIRGARAKAYGISVEDVSESRNPDGNGAWAILPRTEGYYNNPYGLSESDIFANALNQPQMIAA